MRRGEGGISILEVLIATVVLTVGLVGGVQMLAISVNQHQLSRGATDATRLAHDKIDELMKLDFPTAPAIQVSPPNPDPLTVNVANYFDVPGNGMYTRRWRVDPGPAPNTRLLTVQLVPTQTDRNIAKPVQLVTVIRRW